MIIINNYYFFLQVKKIMSGKGGTQPVFIQGKTEKMPNFKRNALELDILEEKRKMKKLS